MARAAIIRGERVTRDFVEQVCTGYSSVLRTQTSGYQDVFIGVLSDWQMRGEHLGGYRACLGEEGQALHVGENDCD